MLQVSRNTVRRYLCGGGVPHYKREARPSKLDQYKQYITETGEGRRAGMDSGDDAAARVEGARLSGRFATIRRWKDRLAVFIAAQPSSSSSPMSEWRRCSDATSGRSTSSAGSRARYSTTTCGRWRPMGSLRTGAASLQPHLPRLRAPSRLRAEAVQALSTQDQGQGRTLHPLSGASFYVPLSS
jgi:hypothetical protein